MAEKPSYEELEKKMRDSEEKYRIFFKEAPISLWEEDFSSVKQCIEKIGNRDIENLSSYFDSHPEVITDCVSRIKISDVNDAALSLFQAGSKKELENRLAYTFTEESLHAFKEALIALYEGKMSFSAEMEMRTLNGKTLFIFLQWVIPSGYENLWKKVLVSMVDITPRKDAENRLGVFSMLLDQSANSIAILNVDGRIEYANPKLLELAEMPLEQVIGNNWRSFLSPHSTLHEKFPEIRKTAFINEEVWSGEIRGISKNGENIWRHATIFPIRNTMGEVIRFAYVGIDTTKRRNTENRAGYQCVVKCRFRPSGCLEQYY